VSDDFIHHILKILPAADKGDKVRRKQEKIRSNRFHAASWLLAKWEASALESKPLQFKARLVVSNAFETV